MTDALFALSATSECFPGRMARTQGGTSRIEHAVAIEG